MIGFLIALALGGSPLPPDVKPWPIGIGPGFRLPAAPTAVRDGAPVGRFRCSAGRPRRVGVHLELFVRRRVLIIPGSIGVARRARCSYPLRTTDPTGVIEVRTSARTATLGDFFELWGQRLDRHRIAGFRTNAPILAFFGGKRRPGDPRSIPLRRHAQIVLELGGYVPPHPRYLFANGL